MSPVRVGQVLSVLLLIGTAAFMFSEYAGLPNAIDMVLTGLQVLCVAVMLGLCVMVATTTKLDRNRPEDDSV